MSALKGTPGPWEIVREFDPYGSSDITFVEKIGPFHIEWHDDLNNGQPDRIEADIAAVSAVHDLAQALHRAVTWCEECGDTRHKWYHDAKAALAKAGA